MPEASGGRRLNIRDVHALRRRTDADYGAVAACDAVRNWGKPAASTGKAVMTRRSWTAADSLSLFTVHSRSDRRQALSTSLNYRLVDEYFP